MTTAEEVVGKLVSMFRGDDVTFGDYVLRHPGGKLDFTMNEENGDLKIVFMGKRPVASYFVFNLSIKGLTVCAKGIKVDVTELPNRVDPFIPWDKLKGL